MQYPSDSGFSEPIATAMHIPGYQIQRQIGRGGMATVYLALQESLQRHVALKVIAPGLKGDPDFTKRFLREGQLVAKLTDPRIITVFDIGIHEDVYYLAMEYLSGGTLKERIEAGLPLESTLQIIKTVAGALGHAHRRGIVHRDIKPQNIIFHENGDPVLTDFGIAKAIGANTVMTISGMSFGTPRYMSPEQIKGQAIDGRSDLYSLGVLFYEMLTGELPYTSDDSFALAFKHVTEPIPALPPDLALFQPLLNRLLAKNPDDRFYSAEQFLNELHGFEEHSLLTRTQVSETAVLPVFTPHQQKAVGQSSDTPTRSAKPWIIGSLLTVTALSLMVSLYLYTPFLAFIEAGNNADQAPSGSQQQTQDTPAVPVFLARAQQHQQDEAFQASLDVLDEGLDTHPDNAQLLALRVEVQKQLDAARLQASETEQRQREADRLLQRAQRYQQRGNREAALMDVEEGLNLAPQHNSLLALQETLVKQQQTEQQQIEQTNQQVREFLEKARASQARGDLDASADFISQGLNLVPDHPDLLALRSEVDQQMEAAAEAERREVEAERREKADQLLARARRLYEQNQFQASLEAVEQGLEIAPDRAGFLDLRREVEAKRQAQSQIVNRLETCAQHVKANRLTTGEGGNATTCYNEVLALDPGNPEALAGLEQVADKYASWAAQSLQRGNLENTKAYLQRLAQVNPEFPRLGQLQRQLASLEAQPDDQGPSAPPSAQPQRAGTDGQDLDANPPTSTQADAAMAARWNSIKDSDATEDFEAFLDTFGDNPRYALAARLKLERLRREQTPSEPAAAGLAIEANVPDANVWVDGQDYGPRQEIQELQPGSYRVEVKKQGYADWQGQVELDPGATKKLQVRLNQLPEPPQQKAPSPPLASFGCLEGNCTNGTGTYLFKNGDRFSGEWRNSKIHTHGTYLYKNGEKYIGEFEGGRINGEGTYYYNSGNRYEGQWKDGIKSGTGTHYYAARGERYEGDFENDKPHGKGTYYYRNGDRYEGEWQNGRKHGEGTYYHSNGEKYAGLWENNKKIKVFFLDQ